jgi:hypothetical protein
MNQAVPFMLPSFHAVTTMQARATPPIVTFFERLLSFGFVGNGFTLAFALTVMLPMPVAEKVSTPAASVVALAGVPSPVMA